MSVHGETGAGGASPGREMTWDEFGKRLGRLLAWLEVEQFLIMSSRPHPEVYVQLGVDPEGMVVETAGDQFLPDDRKLTAPQVAALQALGWRPPGDGVPGSPNHSLTLPWPLRADDVVELVVRTLRDVHGVAAPSELVLDAGSLDGSEVKARELIDHFDTFEASLPRLSASSGAPLRTRLLARACQFTGWSPKRIVDDDGDLQLRDTPFGVWVRAAKHGPGIAFVACPLMSMRSTQEASQAMEALLENQDVAWAGAPTSIQLFASAPESVLDDEEEFRERVEHLERLGEKVVAALQPVFGGLTGEQFRVLRFWRGQDDEIEREVAAVVSASGGTLLPHGWNLRVESAPLLVAEEGEDRPRAQHFATVDAAGVVRLRSAVLETRDGREGFALSITRIDPETARTWAARLGLDHGPVPLRIVDLRSLSGRSWPELRAALAGLPHDAGEAWVPLDRS